MAKNIINFASDAEFKEFLLQKRLMEIGSGSEGVCFKSQVDKKAYKIDYSDFGCPIFINSHEDSKTIDDIISSDEVSIDAFAFPETFLAVKGVLRGYVSKYVEKDYFRLFDDQYDYVIDIDFIQLIKAYKKMKLDVKELSKHNIRIYDLPFNLLFDGEKLIAIDTTAYSRSNHPDLERLNLESLDYAIKMQLEMMFDGNYEFINSLKGKSIEEYIRAADMMIKKRKKEEKKFEKQLSTKKG